MAAKIQFYIKDFKSHLKLLKSQIGMRGFIL